MRYPDWLFVPIWSASDQVRSAPIWNCKYQVWCWSWIPWITNEKQKRMQWNCQCEMISINTNIVMVSTHFCVNVWTAGWWCHPVISVSLSCGSWGTTEYEGCIVKINNRGDFRWLLPCYCHFYRMITFLLQSSTSFNTTKGLSTYIFQTSFTICISICSGKTEPWDSSTSRSKSFKRCTWGVWHRYCLLTSERRRVVYFSSLAAG